MIQVCIDTRELIFLKKYKDKLFFIGEDNPIGTFEVSDLNRFQSLISQRCAQEIIASMHKNNSQQQPQGLGSKNQLLL